MKLFGTLVKGIYTVDLGVWLNLLVMLQCARYSSINLLLQIHSVCVCLLGCKLLWLFRLGIGEIQVLK